MARGEQTVRQWVQEISALMSGKGEITCPQDVADEFGRFFSKIVGVTSEGQEKSHLRNDPGPNGGYKVQFKFKEVDEGDVLKVLKILDPNKACGADEIGSKLLRMVAPGICQSLASLFNSSLRSGQVPQTLLLYLKREIMMMCQISGLCRCYQ